MKWNTNELCIHMKKYNESIYRNETKRIIYLQMNGIHLHFHLVLKMHWENEMKWKTQMGGTATETTNSTKTTNH